jgi:hypothetical protein
MQHEYGLRQSALEWFGSYFADRQQHVNLGSYQSDDVLLYSGCPQGSVIGPACYNLYTAPLARIIETHSIQYHKYADDLQLYLSCSVNDIAVAKAKLESCLSDVRKCMLRWHLKINDDKTDFVVFHNRRVSLPLDTQIHLGGCDIPASNTVRNFGVVFDFQLQFNLATTLSTN